MNNSIQPDASLELQIEPPASLRMILTMGCIGLVSGILIVLTFQLTLPVITRNKAAALERAIFEVVPGAESKSAFQVADGKLVLLAEDEKAPITYYAGYDGSGRLVGVAVEASGQGFQDTLRILYGYAPEQHCIVGLKVLESKETPGLGDKIEKDADFRANFEALEAKASDDGSSILHPIELAKNGKKISPWQIESITGATISSQAIANILHDSTATVVPLLMDNLLVLAKGAE